MLNDKTKQEIRDTLERIKAAMPTFRSRSGQRMMIAEIAKAFARCPDPAPEGKEPAKPAPGTSVVCINGGTGIGKSLAYALPGIILARQKGKKLVISSSTVALQEQLTTRDLPFFFGAAGINAKIEIAKGRTRYACVYRLMQADDDLGQTSMFGREERAQKSAEVPTVDAAKTVAAMIARYNGGGWNGDRDAWDEPVSDTFWGAVTTDRHGCLGRNCPAYQSCAQVAAKKRLKDADVIVANHDLVLADLAMGGKIIAKPEEVFFVIDEAHHLPDRAVSAFATSHFVGAGRRMMEKVATFASSASQALGSSHSSLTKNLASLAERLGENLDDAYQYFNSLQQLKPTEAQPRPTLV